MHLLFMVRRPTFEVRGRRANGRPAHDAVPEVLREPLLRARPGSQWAEDELAGGALPPGE
ncbi:hypothetical protein GCM10009665_58870 [Kitasatospora nipponensis]|uniref:Transposase n=1 Tax=Kitasatospora nipponensis TaxID=258049 RepID=A0ABP4HIT0_9ACTN